MTGHRDRHRTTPDMSGLSGQGNLDKKPDIGGGLSRRGSPRLFGLSGAPSFVRGPAPMSVGNCPALGFLLGDATATEKGSSRPTVPRRHAQRPANRGGAIRRLSR